MRISTYLSVIILVCLFGGYIVEYVLGEQHKTVQTQIELHHENHSTVKDFNHIQHNISQLLVSADLIFASNETFLIQGAIEQSNLVLKRLNGLRETSQIFKESELLNSIIKNIATINELLNKAYESSQLNEPAQFDNLLNTYDDTSIVLVSNLDIVKKELGAEIQHEASGLTQLNQATAGIKKNLIVAFSILILLIWYWANRSISKPLKVLAEMATQVNKTGHFHGIEKGPKEVLILSNELSILTNTLLHQANHDPLTNLLNRREFERQLSQTLESLLLENDDESHIVFYIDLDRFKIVNDICGHAKGDELLNDIAEILTHNARATDVIARVGGDEFTMLLKDCCLTSAIELGKRILNKIENACYVFGDKEFYISASIGLTPMTGDEESIQDIINVAESACRIAKDSGRNQLQVLEATDERVHHNRREMLHLNEIINAIDESRLVLFFQDIVPLGDNVSTGKHYEILVRLKTEEGELLSPFHFLSVIERYQLCSRLDKWVVYETIKLLSQHPDELEKLEVCSINLSGQSFSSETFRQFILNTIEEFKFPGNKLMFEVTETEAISDIDMAIDFVKQLKKLNVRFALDDFGSGHASFEYLKNLPVNFIKIDGSFVKSMCEDPADFATVKSIVEVGKASNKTIIAEFVHSKQIVEKLLELKVDYAQGYYYSEPRRLVFDKPQANVKTVHG